MTASTDQSLISNIELRALRQELSVAHHAVIDMVPAELEACVNAIWNITDTASAGDWYLGFIDQVLEVAKEQDAGWGRAPCPLCWSTPPTDGWGWTQRGLRWHLVGVHRIHQCNPMRALTDFAYRQVRR